MGSSSALSIVIAFMLWAIYNFAYGITANRLFLFLSLGWLIQALYIGAENLLFFYAPSSVLGGIVQATSILSALCFLASVKSFRSRLLTWFLILAPAVCIAFSVILPFPTFALALTSSINGASLLGLSLHFFDYNIFRTLLPSYPRANFERVRRSWTNVNDLKDIDVMRRFNNLLRLSRPALSFSLLGYGLLQFAYPLLSQSGPPKLSAIFFSATLLKIIHAAGLYGLLLASFSSLAGDLQAKTVFEELGALAAGIEHDARTPIGIIARDAESLSRKYAHDQLVLRRTSSIKQALDRIRAVLEIVPMIREDKEYYRVRTQVASLMDVIHSAIKLLQNVEPVTIRVHQDTHSDLQVNAFRDRLVQAVRNILLNAVEASRSRVECDDMVVFVTIEKKNDRQATILIRDSGPGIAADQLSHLFLPGFTTKQGLNRGIGLFLANRFVSQNEGSIQVRSDGISYTEVHITLPYIK